MPTSTIRPFSIRTSASKVRSAVTTVPPLMIVLDMLARSSGSSVNICPRGRLVGTRRPREAASGQSTIPAVSTTACSSTLAPAAAHSGVISSASLCDSPSTQGHITIAVGATRLIQQAS